MFSSAASFTSVEKLIGPLNVVVLDEYECFAYITLCDTFDPSVNVPYESAIPYLPTIPC